MPIPCGASPIATTSMISSSGSSAAAPTFLGQNARCRLPSLSRWLSCQTAPVAAWCSHHPEFMPEKGARCPSSGARRNIVVIAVKRTGSQYGSAARWNEKTARDLRLAPANLRVCPAQTPPFRLQQARDRADRPPTPAPCSRLHLSNDIQRAWPMRAHRANLLRESPGISKLSLNAAALPVLAESESPKAKSKTARKS